MAVSSGETEGGVGQLLQHWMILIEQQLEKIFRVLYGDPTQPGSTVKETRYFFTYFLLGFTQR